MQKEVKIVVRLHPNVSFQSKFLKYNKSIINGTFFPDVQELSLACDCLITDYSSIIFEYSLFERPLLFFAYDMQEYLDERGFFYPIREMMPGPICSTTQELTEILKTPGAEFDLVRVREFKYRFMSGCDGHATARIMQLMDRISEKNSNER